PFAIPLLANSGSPPSVPNLWAATSGHNSDLGSLGVNPRVVPTSWVGGWVVSRISPTYTGSVWGHPIPKVILVLGAPPYSHEVAPAGLDPN
ncbi:hypothetical protein MT418_008280, partial [Batrachochytrium dendrobatidis]